MESHELMSGAPADLAWGSDPSAAHGSEKVRTSHLRSLLIVLMITLIMVIGSMALRDIHLVNFIHFQIDVLANHASY